LDALPAEKIGEVLADELDKQQVIDLPVLRWRTK
jgi:hypothetical protein